MTPFQKKLQQLNRINIQKMNEIEKNPNYSLFIKNRWQAYHTTVIQQLIESYYFELTKEDIQSLKQIPQDIYNQLPRKHRECLRALYLILEKEKINHEIL